jgi:guanylate kinase
MTAESPLPPPAVPSRGHLYVIAAPSGTGKTSLVKALMAETPSLGFSVSHTTRPRRVTEVDGRDYHFTDKDAFRRMIAAGEFLEHAEVFDNLYGTGRAGVEDALARGRDLLLEIDWQGAQQVRGRLPEALDIFILPPSRAALESRLRGRGTDTDEVIARRLRDSVTELSHWHEFRYVIVNDDFEQALADLRRIVAGDRDPFRSDRPALGAFAAELLA